MSVAILVPVLDRPHRIEPLLANIAATTPEPHEVVFATSDNATIEECNRLGAWQSIDDGDTWPNRINRLFRETDDDFVFLCADDVLFHPGWLAPLLEAQGDIDMIGGVTVPADLHNPYGTLALVSRSYIAHFGGCVNEPGVVLHSGYEHCWSETELFETAKSRARHRYVPESVVEHLHYSTGRSNALPNDATYAKGDPTMWSGGELFVQRRRLWMR
ncbi:MAG TPA: glycosyltransferase family 2 protein [Polyangia bacterium]|nr:glycosyltransferase family 2 protein [Polyangia bacterium]